VNFPGQDLNSLSEADQELIRTAANHAKERYKEYFISIGSALRAKSGKIYTGINLKYGVRNISACAETMAIHKALDDDETELDTVVGVKYSPGTDSYEIVNGCGWCRQLFCYSAPLKVITNDKGRVEVREAEDLLPLAFM
jgi:cytidine deaminase